MTNLEDEVFREASRSWAECVRPGQPGSAPRSVILA